MVQFCCGRDDCSAAGIIGLPGRDEHSSAAGSVVHAASGGARSLRLVVNGTEVKPAYLGPPKTATSRRSRKAVTPRAKGICDGKWTPVAGKEDYTRPADGAQIVSKLYKGPVEVQITKTRTQGWSTTIEASIGFEDVLSLGVSFSEEFSESESDSEAATYPLEKGEEGYVAWTSYLRCSQGKYTHCWTSISKYRELIFATGSGTCDGEKVSGEVCTPYLDQNSGMLAGVYSLVQQG